MGNSRSGKQYGCGRVETTIQWQNFPSRTANSLVEHKRLEDILQKRMRQLSCFFCSVYKNEDV
jgi:hypothetical protein